MHAGNPGVHQGDAFYPATGACWHYFFRLFFQASVFLLASVYNHTERHFPLFITWKDFVGTIVAGFCFLCCGIVYRVLARKTNRD
jgi:hypothetical protein